MCAEHGVAGAQQQLRDALAVRADVELQQRLRAGNRMRQGIAMALDHGLDIRHGGRVAGGRKCGQFESQHLANRLRQSRRLQLRQLLAEAHVGDVEPRGIRGHGPGTLHRLQHQQGLSCSDARIGRP